tara:strand:- start:206 stop:445 length:240 start_codon:yes stop_codon:yes gene_type:complete
MHEIHKQALTTMQERGGQWAAYCNQDMGHPDLGHLQFLRFGAGCTFTEAPKPKLPDTPSAINWRYQYVGTVNLETGKVE